MKKVEEHYNNWTVLYIGEPKKETGKRNCVARCDCGRLHINDYYMVKKGRTKMCKACSQRKTKNAFKHGMLNTRLYRIWCGIKYRCGKDKNYLNISYCKEWGRFNNFYNWAINNGYKDNLTIDRIDNDGNYCPENCRWTTKKEQTRNTKRNHFILFLGKERTIGEVSEIVGVSYNTLWARIKRGWTVEQATKGIR